MRVSRGIRGCLFVSAEDMNRKVRVIRSDRRHCELLEIPPHCPCRSDWTGRAAHGSGSIWRNEYVDENSCSLRDLFICCLTDCGAPGLEQQHCFPTNNWIGLHPRFWACRRVGCANVVLATPLTALAASLHRGKQCYETHSSDNRSVRPKQSWRQFLAGPMPCGSNLWQTSSVN